MANYEIASLDESSVLYREKQLNRLIQGAFFIAFGGVVLWLGLAEMGRDHSLVRLVGPIIGVAAVLLGAFSIIRRGWIRIDQATERIEFFGGFQKFRLAPRVVRYDEVAAVEVRTLRDHGNPSYAVDLVIEGAPDIVLDQTKMASYANSLAQEAARRIGCQLQGHAA